MAPLDHQRLTTTGPKSLSNKTTADDTFASQCNELKYIIDVALERARDSLAYAPGTTLPRDWAENKLDCIRSSSSTERAFEQTTTRDIDIKKGTKPHRRTIADYECAATLLLFARQPVVHAKRSIGETSGV
jgi:hypothetical protein